MIRRLKKIELKTRAALAIAMLVFSCSLGEDGNNHEVASIELPHGAENHFIATTVIFPLLGQGNQMPL